MIPAADFKSSQKSMNSTFTMANISPQCPSLNRGVWSNLESWLRQLLSTDNNCGDGGDGGDGGGYKELIIITGPVFAPVRSANGKWVYIQKTVGTFPKLVSVPTHFYKVVLAKKYITTADIGQGGGEVGGEQGGVNVGIESLDIAAFLVPNNENVESSVSSSLERISSLESYLVRLDQLECIVGMTFFDDIISPIEKEQIDSAVPVDRDLLHILDSNVADEEKWMSSKCIHSNKSGRSKEMRQSGRYTRAAHLCNSINCSLSLSRVGGGGGTQKRLVG